MARISDFCQREDHTNCPIQQPQDFDYPNCQCECHSEIPGTNTADIWDL